MQAGTQVIWSETMQAGTQVIWSETMQAGSLILLPILGYVDALCASDTRVVTFWFIPILVCREGAELDQKLGKI